MSKAIQRTVIASSLLTHKILGLKYPLVQYTTLNEKLDIQSGVTGDDVTITPTMGVWTIGDGGHNFGADADGIPYVTPIQHRPSDFGAFNQTPFVLRLPANDLSAALRANYALRKEVVINDVTYYGYYGKRIDLTDVAVQMQRVVIADGVQTSTEFIPNLSNLSPSKPTIVPTTITTTDGEYLLATAPIMIDFSEFDATEYMNVAKILYGNENRAVVSEIMLCTGVDKNVSVPTAGGNVTFKESVMTQIYTHITAYYAIGFANQGFEFTVDLGHTEPLAAEGNISASGTSAYAAIRSASTGS